MSKVLFREWRMQSQVLRLGLWWVLCVAGFGSGDVFGKVMLEVGCDEGLVTSTSQVSGGVRHRSRDEYVTGSSLPLPLQRSLQPLTQHIASL